MMQSRKSRGGWAVYALMPIFLAWGGLALAEESSKYAVVVVQLDDPTDREGCIRALEGAFKKQDIDVADPETRRAVTGACSAGIDEVVLVVPKKKAADPFLTIAVTGSYQDGNANAGNVGGTIGLKRKFSSNQLELTLRGQWLLEDGGARYHSFELAVSDEYFLGAHWSLFAYAAIGRDTKKSLAFYAGETLGAMYSVFARDSVRQLKVSVGAGHRYEDPLDATRDITANGEGFSSNNGILSWRAKYSDKFFDGALEVIAAVWFQHILYSPPNGVDSHRVFDVTDYRVFTELSLKIRIAQLGPGREAYATIGGTYEYFARPIAESPDDLMIQGGIGVSF